MAPDPFALAGEYHRNLPDRIIQYLHRRGISDEVIAIHRIGWNGQRITIPIFTREGTLALFKLAKDPDDSSNSPKTLTSRGGSLELYGWENLLAKPERIIVCEGEFDRLVLETQGLPAVTGTGGAGSFRAEWAPDFLSVPEVYLCFDRDDAGRRGALRVGQFVPHARIVDLPADVGPGGDIADYFVRLEHSREQFMDLLVAARPVPLPPATLPVPPTGEAREPSPFALRAAEIKRRVSIVDVVSQHVQLRVSGQGLRGRCPFHEDHNPSLMVYAGCGRFRCYGCDRHGDVIEFFMLIKDVPFLHAIDELELFESHSHGDRIE